MKRSEINGIMREAISFCKRRRFALPPFAFWPLDDWRRNRPAAQEIIDCNCGWDITDFGSGRYEHQGLFLFTIRNGHPTDRRYTKPYCEKLLITGDDQVTPMHFHWKKTEDIINRGGGVLLVELFNSTKDDRLADTPVTVSCDGVTRAVPAGGIVALKPGESITLPPRLYHKFWGKRGTGTVLIVEVSAVNDDHSDNRFHDPVGRFPEIEEDEPPLHLLTIDYAKFL
jgi:D-lyxose ketol-isomerase